MLRIFRKRLRGVRIFFILKAQRIFYLFAHGCIVGVLKHTAPRGCIVRRIRTVVCVGHVQGVFNILEVVLSNSVAGLSVCSMQQEKAPREQAE